MRGLPFNPNDPASILQLDQLAAFAEFESRTISKRVKESFHSALLTSGKFSGNYPLLGFDAVKNEYGEYTGIYTPNKEELKQVELIMKQFLLVDRYSVLLAWCKKMNIKSKRGKDFRRLSIKALLTNPRYIGKWYRNKHNAGKRQNKLMPYERFTEVELGYGCVVDKGLWQKVQGKVRALSKSRARSTTRCYPLSGLLVYPDGSNFVGSSTQTSSHRTAYYLNKTHRIRVRTGIFEGEAEKILCQVVENSAEFRASAANYAEKKDSSIRTVAGKIARVDARLAELEDERRQLDRRLSFLLDGDNVEAAQSFRDEYQRGLLALKKEERELESSRGHLQLLKKQIADTQDLHKSNVLKQAVVALGYIKSRDAVSLKSIYGQLFQKIIVRPLDTAQVQLEFIFNDASTALNRVVDTFRTSVAWARVAAGQDR